jgi:nitroimidazol reductase NimA-like FMN-containing flavoprotein (pyridoxamine 5'-phosphate oxidase superfamily)
MNTTRLEELSRDECILALDRVPVGRVGITSQALPHIFPVNFKVLDEAVYFRTESGTKLDAATAASVVAFQADAYAPDGSAGWSVLAIGPCHRVDESAEGPAASRAIDDLRVAWPLSGQAQRTVRIDLITVTGRRFGDLGNSWLP